MKYFASCSFGKDSLAMVLRLIEEDAPLDEVVFYDTGMEFKAIYSIRETLKPILERNGIGYTELKPKEPFLYTMLERPCESKQNGKHYGYGWCGGVCRWGTTGKQKALDEHAEKNDAVVYVGIAADEQSRLDKQKKPNRVHPLAEWGMTEADCLSYCRERGWNWNEKTPETASGYIDLYDILDRVSCWCCSNKNRKELYNIWKYLPQYWKQLLALQSKLERPMKKFCTKQYGEYGNLFDLEKVFELEAMYDDNNT